MRVKSIIVHTALIVGICDYSVLPCRAELDKEPSSKLSDLALRQTTAADVETDSGKVRSILAKLKEEGLLEAPCKDTSLLHYLKFAQDDAECALSCVRMHIERRLRLLAIPTCKSAPPACISELLSHLQLNKVLTSRQVNALLKFTPILNDASHARWSCSPEVEEWVVKESPKLMATLESLAARAL